MTIYNLFDQMQSNTLISTGLLKVILFCFWLFLINLYQLFQFNQCKKLNFLFLDTAGNWVYANVVFFYFPFILIFLEKCVVGIDIGLPKGMVNYAP